MGRPVMIENEELIRLVDDYFFEKRKKPAKKVKYSDVAKYIAENGYPDYRDCYLRRNSIVREHIDELIAKENEYLTTLVSYTPLDVANIVNYSKSKLTQTLTATNSYYKKVAESAVYVFKQKEDLQKQKDKLVASLKEKNLELEELKNRVDKLQQKNKQLQSERDALNGVVQKYVYPEIANKLLSDAGIAKLPHDHIVDDPEIITAKTELPITGRMMHLFKEE